MLIGVLAASIGVVAYTPPANFTPEDVRSPGYALVFTDSAGGSFEVFYKAPGKSWDDVPDAQQAVRTHPLNPWLVFHLYRKDMDVSLKVKDSKDPSLDRTNPCDFEDYFEADEFGDVQANNFGLHDIY